METINWHNLDRESILYWMLPHVMAGRSKEEFDGLSLASNGYQELDVKLVINGFEFDGAILIQEIFASMEASFDRAVTEKVEEMVDFTKVEDIMSSTMQLAKQAVYNKLRQAGFSAMERD